MATRECSCSRVSDGMLANCQSATLSFTLLHKLGKGLITSETMKFIVNLVQLGWSPHWEVGRRPGATIVKSMHSSSCETIAVIGRDISVTLQRPS